MNSETEGFPVTESAAAALADVDREPISLHAALRRVIVTNADPDTAAHRARGVLARWLRDRAARMNDESHFTDKGVASRLAEELEAGTATAAEADAEIARLREQVESVRADERQRCTEQLTGLITLWDANAVEMPGLVGEAYARCAHSLEIARINLTIDPPGASSPAVDTGEGQS